ncbi:hypothetical protein MOO05_20315 [Escherichia coli]|nr:hypothetical protein [Escherichia coli]MCJ8378233.1 hypothetical protein [Escherichia coli]MCJ8420340.1 hypothetical protein [Escherichia coli]
MPTKAELQTRVEELEKENTGLKKCWHGQKGSYLANFCQKNCHQQIYQSECLGG